MAYSDTAQLMGDKQKYSLSSEIKKYSLRDVGFVESKNGKFQFEQSLDPSSPYNQGFKFKMVVEADLKKFKMVTTTANGIREVNIFTRKDKETHIEQLNYILNNLIERKIIAKI